MSTRPVPAADASGGAVDLFSKFDPLIRIREGLLATGVKDPFGLVMEKVLSPTRAICNGRETILLGTYNYMGMTFDEDVIAAGKQALDEFGSGTTGSRVLNGTYVGHKAVEEALKDFYAMWRRRQTAWRPRRAVRLPGVPCGSARGRCWRRLP